MYRRKKTTTYIATLFALVVIGASTALAWFGYSLVMVKGSAVAEFEVAAGQGVNQISANLHEAGVIRSKLAFESYLYLRDLEGSIKAGKYVVPASSIRSLTQILLQGPPPPETRATLIEGWTVEDYAEKLSSEGLVDKEVFLDIVSHPVANGFTAENFPLLYAKSDNVDLEGYLFPDTYRFFDDVEELEIIKFMVKNLTSKITKEMALEIDSQGKTFHEILTMASIIEKEVITDRDRRIASGVLWNRIELGIPLQVDSTVNYITGGNKPAVTIKETKIDNPFNTYVYKGLPPGPIANPSLSSIMAAIYPTDTDYLFYLSTPEGETIFSENLEQHNAAKNKYLR